MLFLLENISIIENKYQKKSKKNNKSNYQLGEVLFGQYQPQMYRVRNKRSRLSMSLIRHTNVKLKNKYRQNGAIEFAGPKQIDLEENKKNTVISKIHPVLILVNYQGRFKTSISLLRYLMCPQQLTTLEPKMQRRAPLFKKQRDSIRVIFAYLNYPSTQSDLKSAIEFKFLFLALRAATNQEQLTLKLTRSLLTTLSCFWMKVMIALPKFLGMFFVSFLTPSLQDYQELSYLLEFDYFVSEEFCFFSALALFIQTTERRYMFSAIFQTIYFQSVYFMRFKQNKLVYADGGTQELQILSMFA